MDYKKVKKGETTLTGTIISLLLVIGIFSGMFLLLNQQAERNNLQVDSKYNETYQRLLQTQTNIDNNINEIQNNLDDIKEADNTYQIAWNGLKGLGNVLTLPISFISRGVDVYDAIIISGDIIPTQQLNLIRLGIITFLVLLIIAVLAGGSNKI